MGRRGHRRSFLEAASEGQEIERLSEPSAASDVRGFDLGMLSGDGVDASALLPQLWPQAEASGRAGRARNLPRFTEFDGRLDSEAMENWSPLERSWTASALETYVTCPYRFYLRHVLGVRADSLPSSDRPDRRRRLEIGRLQRRISGSVGAGVSGVRRVLA